MVVQLKINV